MNEEILNDETRRKLKDFSKTFLRLHKTLLDAAKIEYEAKNGAIKSVNQYFHLVLEDAHFAWLRKISSLIALIDEAVSMRRPATQAEAESLLNEARILLYFENADEEFNKKFQNALRTNPNAVVNYNETLNFVK